MNNKILRIEENIVSHLFTRTPEELKKLLPILRRLRFSEKNRAIITLAEEYVKTKVDNSFNDFVFYQVSDTDYFTKLVTKAVGKKLFASEFVKLSDIQEQEDFNRLVSNPEKKPVKQIVAEVKSFKPNVQNKPKTLSEIRDSRLDERLMEKDAPLTGYKDLDLRIKGFLPGHVYTMTGDTNVGKTQIACNFAFRVAIQGRRVLYFALEPDNTIIDYLASVWSGKPFISLVKEDLEPPVEIDVYTKDQVGSLDEMVQIVQDSDRYDLIVIDHFGYFTTSEKVNKVVQESNAMKVLAQLAKQQRTAILSVVHLRKPASETKKAKIPSMNDISGSAAFKQDSTEVLLIYREKREGDQFGLEFTEDAYILVAKTKSGRSGAVPIKFTEGSAVILDSYDLSARF